MNVVAAKKGTATTSAPSASATVPAARAVIAAGSGPRRVGASRHLLEDAHHLVVQEAVAGEDPPRLAVERAPVEIGGPSPGADHDRGASHQIPRMERPLPVAVEP